MHTLPEIDFDIDLGFSELQDRLGYENAYSILLMLEKMEGINESAVKKHSPEERFCKALRLMLDSAARQTMH